MEEQKWIRRKEKFKKEGNLQQLSDACSKLGDFYFRHNQYEEALKEFKEEAELREVSGNIIELAVANRMIGEVYTNMGQYNKALKHHIKYLELAKAKEDQIEEQRALATIGRTYFFEADSIPTEDERHWNALTHAKNAYKKSLDLCERLKGIGKREHMEMRARLLLNIGLVLECQQEKQKAIENMQKALQICKEHDLFEDLYRCYLNVGMMYHRQSDSSRALTMLDLALEVAGRLPDKAQLCCEILLNKAEVLFSLPDFHGAKQALRRAYKLNTPMETDRESITKNLKLAIVMCDTEDKLLQTSDTDHATKKKLYETMGDGFSALKNYTKAIEYYRKMLESAEILGDSGQQLAAVYVSLSQTYRDNKQYDLALEFFQKELELWENNPAEACQTTRNIAEVLDLNGASYEELQETYNRARRLAQEASSQKLEATVLRDLLTIQNQKGHKMLAAETQRELELIEANLEEESSGSEDDASSYIGSNICLETYEDSESDNEDMEQQPHAQPRRRPARLRIKKNEKGETQLHMACMNGNLTLVKKLIEQGHPVNVRDYCGWLPLHEASNHGHRDIVEYLLDKGAAVNDRGGSQCGGVTSLHDAASCGHLGVMEVLLDRGASILCRTNEGDTPLDCLMKWYQRSGTKFDPVEQTFFEEIQTRLRTALQKAGHHITSSVTESRNKERSRSSTSHRRTLDDSSEDEIPTPRLRAVSPVQESSASSSPLPLYSQDVDGDDDDGWIGNRQAVSQNAADEYRSVMTMLRTKEHANKERKLNSKVKQAQGFLQEEDAGEDWLENDVVTKGRPIKRRCLERNRLESSSGPSRRFVAEDVNNEDVDIEEVMTPEEEHRTQVNNVVLPQKTRTQGKLDVFVQPSRSEVEPPVRSVTPQPAKPIESAVRVRVDSRLLLVPVQTPEQQSIGWLAREAARRYYSVEGLQPSLNLHTKDGALLSEDDPVSLIGREEELVATVTSWNIPPLTDRYMEACRTLHAEPDAHINSCLEASQATQSLQLSDLALTTHQLAPLFRALTRQHTLQHLHLAGNCMGDEGVTMLGTGLSTLSQLRQLDLSCNNISVDGVLHLSSILSTAGPVLKTLTHLDLSHNPLGDASMKHLSAVLVHLESLSVLKLQNCHLTSSCFRSGDLMLKLDCIQELDVSYNSLGGRGLSGFLVQLCPTQIVSLNLAATASSDSSVTQELTRMFAEKREFPRLTTLDLSDCGIRDEDIWNLLRELHSCSALRSLHLGGNPELSSVSLRRLMQHEPALHALDLSGCCSITDYLGESSLHLWMQQGHKRLELLTISVNSGDETKAGMEKMWLEVWGRQAHVQRAPGGLLCLSVKE